MSTRNDDGRSPGADPEVTRLLQAHYAPPVDAAYWSGLEQRMLQRLSTAMQETVLRPSWWSGFAELRPADWRTAGLVAATLALLAAGATFVRDRAADAHARDIAARAAVEAAMPLPIDDATLSRARPHLPADAPERYLNPLDY
ncbi:MAG: hypothetical protein LCH84_05750 [Gemmatimonadetes bacterium]|nr:hypothetical protein [Gemmatimonadota bacterium]